MGVNGQIQGYTWGGGEQVVQLPQAAESKVQKN